MVVSARPLKDIEPDNRLPLYQRLRDEMAGRIAGQSWRPGETIPSEQALAEQFGVAVGTMRKAIETLVGEGLLERRQGKGTFVRRADFTSSLFRFFRCQDENGRPLVPERRVLTRDLVSAPAEVAAALAVERGEPCIRLSRLRLHAGEPILAEEIWLPRAPFAALLELSLDEFGDLLYPLYEARCGQVVASAEETLTAEAVDPANAWALRLKPGTPVIVIDRLARGYDRRPLEWRRSRGPADKFRYHVEIR